MSVQDTCRLCLICDPDASDAVPHVHEDTLHLLTFVCRHDSCSCFLHLALLLQLLAQLAQAVGKRPGKHHLQLCTLFQS